MFSIKNILAVEISVTSLTGLNFGQVTQGDIAKVIAPSNINTGENASFSVTGDANTVYNINLPTSISISNGASNLTINNFTSNPPFTNGGLLDVSGKETVYIGATLQSIPINLQPGAYNGTFLIDVSY